MYFVQTCPTLTCLHTEDEDETETEDILTDIQANAVVIM